MNKMLKYLFLGLTTLSSFSASSQKRSLKYDWKITPTITNLGSWSQNGTLWLSPYTQSIDELEPSKIYLEGDQVVMTVAFGNSKYGLVKMGSDLQVKWKTSVNEIPIKLALLNGIILVMRTRR